LNPITAQPSARWQHPPLVMNFPSLSSPLVRPPLLSPPLLLPHPSQDHSAPVVGSPQPTIQTLSLRHLRSTRMGGHSMTMHPTHHRVMMRSRGIIVSTALLQPDGIWILHTSPPPPRLIGRSPACSRMGIRMLPTPRFPWACLVECPVKMCANP